MKSFFAKNAKILLVLAILVVLTVLLLVPTTANVFIGVFGYASYLYLIFGYVAAIFTWKKIRIKLNKNNKILIPITYIFLVSTIHIALMGRASGSLGFGSYVTVAYESPTVGGVVFSLITAPIVLPLQYVASITVFFALTALCGFFIIKPYVFVENKKKAKENIKAPTDKQMYNENLGEEEKITDSKPLPVKAEKKNVKSEEKINTEDKPLSAKELLFGNVEKEKILENLEIKSDTYGIKEYTFEPTEKKKTNLMEGLDKFLPPDKKRQEAKNAAAKQLFSNIEEEQKVKEKEKTIGFDIGETMGYNAYIPTETIFNNENREKEFIVESEEEKLPKIKESSFVQAIRQEGGIDAPKPISIFQSEVKTVKEEKISIEHSEEEEQESEVISTTKKSLAPYNRPPVSVLIEHPSPNFSPYVENYEELKEVFEEKLKNYNIDVTLIKAIKGPTITICVLDLSEKCPISKVYSAKMDIQRLLHSQKEINIIPQIGDSAYFGIEIPNKITATVSFKEIISSPEYVNAKGEILLALGKTADGKILIDDLGAMPHALVAGTTGSGKSVCLNVILASILYRYSPEELKLVLIDLKTVEMAPYAGLPHMLFNNPLSDVTEINNALKWIREETMRRFGVFKKINCRNLKEYNATMAKEDKLPRIVIIIDEASELMTDPKSGKSMDSNLCSLARMARAAGVHLIFATQNPVKEVITNEIQNNLNTKIAFKVGDYNHSMVIFKAKGAETLLGRGDMYIKKGTDMQRAQCAYIDTKEIEDMVDYIKKNNPVEFDYYAIDRILRGGKEEGVVEEIKNTTAATTPAFIKKDLDNDENFQILVREGLRICLETDKVSASLLQREMSKGFNSIAKLVDYLEKKGFISPPYNGNKRNILITKEQFNEMYPEAPLE